MSKNDTFYAYSIKLAAFLILKNQRPYKITTDVDGNYLFQFPNKDRCMRILEEYKGVIR